MATTAGVNANSQFNATPPQYTQQTDDTRRRADQQQQQQQNVQAAAKQNQPGSTVNGTGQVVGQLINTTA